MQILETLYRKFEEQRDFVQAQKMAAYMKDQFAFFGIPAKLRRAEQKACLYSLEVSSEQELLTQVQYLWNLNERECQYAAIDHFIRHKKHWNISSLEFSIELIQRKSWWDTVDLISTNIVGAIIKKHRLNPSPICLEWIQSNNLWLQRCALIFQLKYKQETNLEIIAQNIEALKCKDQFFIQKAIGWSLREISKWNPEYTIELTEIMQLQGLAKREALKIVTQNN